MRRLILAIMVSGTGLTYGQPTNRTQLSLVPVRSLELKDVGVQITFDLPCDAKPVGVFVTTDQQRQTYALAYAIERYSTACAKLPVITQVYLDSLARSHRARLRRLSPNEILKIKRPKLVSPDELEKSSRGVDLRLLVDCRSVTAGVLLREDPVRRKVSLGWMLGERRRSASNRSACSGRYEKLDVEFLNTSKFNIQPWQERKSLARSYDLQIRRVLNASTATVELHFERACNEVPLAVAIQDGADSRIGVLVARFFNFKCRQPRSSKFFIDNFQLGALRLPRQKRLLSMGNSHHFAPFRIQSLRAAVINTEGMQLQYAKSCDGPSAVVLHPNGYQLAASILELNRNKTCNAQNNEVFLKSGVSIASREDVLVYPFRLTGSAFP